MVEDPQSHWDRVYAAKSDAEVSWHQETPAPSLDFVAAAGIGEGAAVIDVGGGRSRLVDALLDRGVGDIAVLDLSETALAGARRRLGGRDGRVRWIVADVTRWMPDRTYDLWHDRAVLHFLTDAAGRAAYVERLVAALRPGGYAIVATFATDGPERCSGLPVVRYSPDSLAATLGDDFHLVESRAHLHATPWGARQSFQFSLFRKRARRA
jgi:SAM-dependent methyltransferase